MRSLSPVVSALARLLVVLLVVSLIGCGGQSTSSTSSQRGYSPSSGTVTATVDSQNSAFPTENTTRVLDISGLFHIQSWMICSPGNFITNTLVLATDRLTYESSEIQQMRTFFNDPLPFRKPLPGTLRWVSGGFSNDMPGTSHSAEDLNLGCNGGLEITNISQTTIQISQVAMRLVADAQPNHYHYRLVDGCTVAGYNNINFCLRGGGSPAGYVFDYSLVGKGKANTVFTGRLSVLNPELLWGLNEHVPAYPTIAPGKEVGILLKFSPATASGSFIYSVVPEITLNMSGVQSVKDLTQLTSTVAIASADHFSCYGLQGDTFVPYGAIWENGGRRFCL